MSTKVYKVDPKEYLLKKIINSKDNGLDTLGSLNAKHIDDIAQVMNDFAIEIINVIGRGEIPRFNYDPTCEAEDMP